MKFVGFQEFQLVLNGFRRENRTEKTKDENRPVTFFPKQRKITLSKTVSAVRFLYLSGRRAPYHLLEMCAWIIWPSFSLWVGYTKGRSWIFSILYPLVEFHRLAVSNLKPLYIQFLKRREQFRETHVAPLRALEVEQLLELAVAQLSERGAENIQRDWTLQHVRSHRRVRKQVAPHTRETESCYFSFRVEQRPNKDQVEEIVRFQIQRRFVEVKSWSSLNNWFK